MTKYFSKEVDVEISEDDILDWVAKNYSPDDVFTGSQLEDWAKHNGYIQESDCEECEECEDCPDEQTGR